MFTRHHFHDGVNDKRVLTYWAEHSGVTLEGNSDFLQGLYGRLRSRVGSGIGYGRRGGEMVDEAVEVGAVEEEVVVGGGEGGGGSGFLGERVSGGGGRQGYRVLHLHLFEGVTVAVWAEEGVGGGGWR